jgi:hypothetical protein
VEETGITILLYIASSLLSQIARKVPHWTQYQMWMDVLTAAVLLEMSIALAIGGTEFDAVR